MSTEYQRTSNQDLTDEDAAEIGRAFMERLPAGYSWSDSPAEYLTEQDNKLHDARAALTEIYEDIPARPNMTEAGRVAMMAEVARKALEDSDG